MGATRDIYVERAKKYLSAKPETRHAFSEMKFINKAKETRKSKARGYSEDIYKKMVSLHNSYFSMVTAFVDGNFGVIYSDEYSSPHGTLFNYMLKGVENIFFSIHSVDRYEERGIGLASHSSVSLEKGCEIVFQSDTPLDKFCLTVISHLSLNEIWFNRIGRSEMYVKIGDLGVLSIHKIGEVYLVKTFMTMDMVKCNNWREISRHVKLYQWLDRAFELTDEVLNV